MCNTLGESRTFGFSNISLVITYTTVVVAALMLAGFLWMAFAYSGQSSSGYGYYNRAKREAYSINQGKLTKTIFLMVLAFKVAFETTLLITLCTAAWKK